MDSEDILSVIERNRIELQLQPAQRNPFMMRHNADMAHWFCRITGMGITEFDFYTSTKSEDGVSVVAPDAVLAIGALLVDLETYRECRGYDDFVSLLGLDDGDAESAVAWGELERIAPFAQQISDLALASQHAPAA
jgi:hypothetical protein